MDKDECLQRMMKGFLRKASNIIVQSRFLWPLQQPQKKLSSSSSNVLHCFNFNFAEEEEQEVLDAEASASNSININIWLKQKRALDLPSSSSSSKTPTHVLLERWAIDYLFDPDADDAVQLETVSKHLMLLCRSLYSLTRLLPAYRLCKTLKEGSRTDTVVFFTVLCNSPEASLSAKKNSSMCFCDLGFVRTHVGRLQIGVSFLESKNIPVSLMEKSECDDRLSPCLKNRCRKLLSMMPQLPKHWDLHVPAIYPTNPATDTNRCKSNRDGFTLAGLSKTVTQESAFHQRHELLEVLNSALLLWDSNAALKISNHPKFR